MIWPVGKAAEGARFLRWVENKRRFYFDNYFKRVLHNPAGDPLNPTSEDERRGYVLFQRDFMRDVYYNDTPFREEVGRPLNAEAFAGEAEILSFGAVPLRNLGTVTISAGNLTGASGTISAAALEFGVVSYRLSRVSMEGTVYTIAPRLILPTNIVEMPQGVTRQFLLRIKTPPDARPGVYRGSVKISGSKGGETSFPVQVTVRKGTLDPLDIPAGPWGHAIGVPWYTDDPACSAFNGKLTAASLRKMREYGFTMFSGVPAVFYKGFKGGLPVLDFSLADAQMKQARELGFLAVCSYGSGVAGVGAYFQDTEAMKAAGFSDYSAFIRSIYSAVQEHAEAERWLPVYWNLADEPLGDELKRSAENAQSYRQAFPKGPPFFTGASSFSGTDKTDPHFQLAKAFHVVDWNGHDEDAVRLLQAAGSDWGFYNGGNRWTFGYYLYKATKEFGLKFRLSWHWNASAGDPYYALDCREDDYAWCNAAPDGRLVPSIEFERVRAGIDDYRHMLTLARLARERSAAPQAKAATELLQSRLSSFKLGQRDHDAIFPPDDWRLFRHKLVEAIEACQ